MVRNHLKTSLFSLVRIISAVLTAVLFIGCTTSHVPSSDVHTRIQAIGNAVGAVRAEDPTLVGLQDYELINRNAFSGRTEEDVNLIVGRVYLDAATQIKGSRPDGAYTPIDQTAAVRRALSQHRPVSKYSRSYFDDLLSDTKRRIATNEQYYCSVATSAQAARYTWNPAWDNYRCIVDGFEMPISACRALVLGDMVETLTIL